MGNTTEPSRVHAWVKSFVAAVTVFLVAGVAVLVASFVSNRHDADPAGGASSPGASAIPTRALADPLETYDPVMAGEPLPAGFRQLLPRDGIPPVYAPEFVEASAVDWHDDTLVIGLEIDGEAKAYPVSYLNGREMVIDSLAGIPVLVTW